MSMSKVNHPEHYNDGGFECIDVMEAVYGKEAVDSFCICNAFKYLWRAGKKDGNSKSQDLQKAKWYIDRSLNYLPKK